MRRPSARSGGSVSRTALIVLFATGVLAACGGAIGGKPTTTSTSNASSIFAVPAVREPLTMNSRSPVAHDNEVMALAAHSGRLSAVTDQWEYSGPSAYGQVLVKNSKNVAWTVFEQTQSVRVEALDFFPIPKDQGLGSGHSLLITQVVVDGRSEIQWLVDGAKSFTPSHSYALSSIGGADVRSFGAHESGGVWAVYAGVEPTGILRGTWSPTKHTLVFNPTPELTAPPGSPGLKTQKVTAFADCGGAVYVSIYTKLYRRNDGRLPPGVPRWVLVYQEAPVGAFNSGLRGLTCIAHDASPYFLVSTEGNGDVYRLDHLPRGQLDDSATASPGHLPGGFVATLEFSPSSAIRQMLATQGTTVPATGKGSIDYVIAAYNNGDFQTIKVGGGDRQAFGFEWAYLGGCPATRTCGPTAFGAATFDAAACFAVRTDQGPSPTYVLRCLSGPQFKLSAKPGKPIRSGQAFVSIRTIVPSPFGDGRLYYGGYDCNFYPADGTAWIATSTLSALHL